MRESVAVVVYDLAALEQSWRHARLCGWLFTELHVLDADHIALVFRSASDERWQAWERTRLDWILEEATA